LSIEYFLENTLFLNNFLRKPWNFRDFRAGGESQRSAGQGR